MDVIVELAPELADDLAGNRPSERAAALREELQRLDTSLEPLHPGTSDPELARYFLARAPAGREPLAATRLRERDGVVAAYVKPAGEAP